MVVSKAAPCWSMVSHMPTRRAPTNGTPPSQLGASGRPSTCTSRTKAVASRIWSARLKPSHTSGSATSKIHKVVSKPAARVSRPPSRRVNRRISGQLA
ncbi:hypothetical protein D3C84_965160 [compost metagenome]